MDYWRSNPDRRVGRDNISGHRISTVFLGQDNKVFETMIFHPKGGEDAKEGIEYARTMTWADAERAHMDAVLSLEGIGGRFAGCEICGASVDESSEPSQP